MLSKKTKYAIKALITLAKNQKEKPYLSIGEISEQGNIPKKFLEAILLELRNAGVLSSKLGKHGGYYLFKKAEDITLTEIIRLTHGPIAMLPCVSLNFYEPCDDCIDESICSIRKAFTELRIASLHVLSNTTIADLVKKERKLTKEKLKS